MIWFKQELRPEYAITSNGGHILHHNDLIYLGTKVFWKRVEHESMNSEDLMARFSTLAHDSWMLGCKKADALFYTCQVNPEMIPEQEVSEFQLGLKHRDGPSPSKVANSTWCQKLLIWEPLQEVGRDA